MANTEIQSKTIAFLKLPLIIGVVFIHSYANNIILNGVDLLEGQDYIYFNTIQNLLSIVIGGICVPAFFFISGFLFYYNYNVLSFDFYKKKILNRVNTLLIPYIVWNLIILFFYLVAQNIPLIRDLFSGNSRLISHYDFSDYLKAFGIGSFPIHYQFWFIRDLFIFSLLSPFIGFLILRFGIKYFVIISFLWLLNINTEIGTEGFLFFSFGALFSLKRKNILDVICKYKSTLMLSYISIAFIDLITIHFNYNVFIHKLGILIGVLFSFNLIASFLKDKGLDNAKNYANYSFVLYTIHEPLLTFIKKALYTKYNPTKEIEIIGIYILVPIIIMIIAFYVYKLFLRFPLVIKNTLGIRSSNYLNLSNKQQII